jgi:membrane protease YdiL (CAAX protease family)
LAAQPWLAFLVTIVQTMLILVIINGIASFGEEFGWRAYLLQKLMVLFAGTDAKAHSFTGARRAAVLVGLIWGIWHFPLFFLGSALTLPFILIYVVYTCSASVLLSWVALRSGSVWPASIGHGMLNGTSSFPMLVTNGTANALLGPGPTGLVGMLGYVILALVLLFNPKAFTGGKEAHIEETRAVLGVQKI